MKLFKKLMAGAMALAMLSVYTVAFATDATDDTTTSGASQTRTVSGAGGYAGDADPVFTMKLPTAAGVNSKLAFTVDPQEIIKNSPPANSIPFESGGSTFGTVIFTTTSGSDGNIYRSESEPLKVISKSSVDVTVNMIATLTDTKMKLYEGDTFSAFSGATDYLYIGVTVSALSGGVSAISGADGSSAGTRIISGGSVVSGAYTVSPLGAKKATVLKAITENFETTVSGGTVTTALKPAEGNPQVNDDSWNYVEYTVVGASNKNADWQIEGIKAPTLNIKWVVDPANKITYAIADPTSTLWTAKLDKDAYQVNEDVTLYVKPNDSNKKVKTVTFDYFSASTAKVVKMTTKVAADPVNGAYPVTFKLPAGIEKNTTVKGYVAPTFTVTLG